MQPSVTVPAPREALVVPQDSTWPLLERQAREKEPGALPMDPRAALLWCLQLPCSGKDQQRFSSPGKSEHEQTRSSRCQVRRKWPKILFSFRYVYFFSLCVFFPEIKTISCTREINDCLVVNTGQQQQQQLEPDHQHCQRVNGSVQRRAGER